ncbi:hypothetical protein CPB86DRAFT_812877 [Serendipita vermifera]|nr:hypothetical protein CPB86DRAFT_812877 [Serendipita vermifera]
MSWTSPEAFMKSLKSSNDVQLALSAWKHADFYIPAKGQTLANWALNQLLKNNQALQDIRIWTLLDSIIFEDTDSIPQWLPTTLHKIPAVPILLSLLRHLANPNESPISENTLLICQHVMKTILPISYPKTRLETTIECLWAALDVVDRAKNVHQPLELVSSAVTGFISAFRNATNKAKIYSLFIGKHFISWLKAIIALNGDHEVQNLVWGVARDILCSLEAMKTILQTPNIDTAEFTVALQNSCMGLPLGYGLYPRLFEDLLKGTRIHRQALSQLKASSSQIFNTFNIVYRMAESSESATALLETLSVVERNSSVIIRDDDWRRSLSETTSWCLTSLERIQTFPEIIISCLASLGRMDYQLIAPHIRQVITAIAMGQEENSQYSELRTVILSYYSKTRMLDELYGHMLASCSLIVPKVLQAPFGIPDSQTRALSVFNGPIFGIGASRVITLAYMSSLTAGQLVSILDMTLSTMSGYAKESALEASFIWRLASIILPALPTERALPISFNRMRIIGNKILQESILPLLRLNQHLACQPFFGHQLLAASNMRFISAISDACPWIDMGNLELKPISLEESGTSGELVLLEEIRLLLRFSEVSDLSNVFQRILGKLATAKKNGRRNLPDVQKPVSMHSDYWYLLTERWINLFEQRGSESQIEDLASTIVSTYINGYSTNARDYRPAHLRRLLKSATFWEMQRIQGAIMEIILERSNKVDDIDCDQLLEDDAECYQLSEEEFSEIRHTFHLLLEFPSDVIKRSNVLLLVRRAICFDGLASRLFRSENSIRDSTKEIIRRFIWVHSLSHPGISNFLASPSIIISLARCEDDLDVHETPNILPQATVAILDLAIQAFFRKNHGLESFSNDFERILSTLPRFQSIGSLGTTLQLEVVACFLRNTGMWSRDHPLPVTSTILLREVNTQLGDTIRKSLTEFNNQVSYSITSILKAFRAHLLTSEKPTLTVEECVSLCIQTTLPVMKTSSMHSKDVQSVYLELLWMMVDELRNTDDQMSCATSLVAIHNIASSETGSSASMDRPLQHGGKLLAIDKFSCLLENVREAIFSTGLCKSQHLIHAARALVTEGPEGSFSGAREAVSQQLSSFNALSGHWETGELSSYREILLYTLHVCQEKPWLLQSSSMASIMTFLGFLTQPSKIGSKVTHTDIFHRIVQTLSTLIRNRRDLMVQCLPHLVVILRRLIGHLRSPQINLGHKQYRNISNQLPPWITVSEPLSRPEAIALSRLLVALNTKNLVRSKSLTPSILDWTREAQSLAKPFSKHASGVLAAYIEVLTDPLCLISREVRVELTPGINSLCEMSGEKGRDALMVTLDNTGKILFKNIWSSYEKQRYEGKG